MEAVLLLLKKPCDFWERVRESDKLGELILHISIMIVISSSIYGYTLASWRSHELGLYVAVKMPILMIGTTSFVMFLNWMAATALRSGMTFRQVVALTYGAMGVTCMILISLVPVTWFFTCFAAPASAVDTSARFTHNCLLLVHVFLVGTAGIAGNNSLMSGFAIVASPSCSIFKLYWCWIISFIVVGCQLAWVLRPFIGSPFFEVAFLRPNCLERNFFEFIFTEVIPFVIGGG